MQTVEYIPATDFLGHSAQLDHRAQFPVLGVPLAIYTNSPTVIEAAQRSFGHWCDIEPQLIEPVAPRIVRVVVHAGTQPYVPQTPFVPRSHSGVLLSSSGDSMLMAQLDRGEGLAFVTPELVADDQHFRYNVLEGMALALASWHDRIPVHAGAVVYDGRAILLVGPSTAGKSTLCYACVRDGFQLLAEDVVSVSLSRGLRMWGSSRFIHLLPDAPRHFPELADVPAHVQANGKLKLAIDVAALGPQRLRHHADRAAVCLLQRSTGPASALEPIDPQMVIDALCNQLEPGFDLFQNTRVAVEALVQRGAYRLTVGSELAGAVALLKQLRVDASLCRM